MVSNNYIMSGGSDYSMLASLPKYGEAGGELETVQAYIEKCIAEGTLQQYAGTQNRIQMRSPGYVPKDYTASILIKDEAGNPLPNKALSYRVDGGARQNGTTDGDGMLRITLTDGSHGVRLADGSCDPIPKESQEGEGDPQGQGGSGDGSLQNVNATADPQGGSGLFLTE